MVVPSSGPFPYLSNGYYLWQIKANPERERLDCLCEVFLVCFEEIEKSKMGSTWEHIAEAANVVQLTGLNAVALIGMIMKAASSARMQKRNCKQFVLHLKLIGNLLEQLKIP